MFTLEHVFLSVFANAIGLCIVLMMKTAPHRLVVYVCVTSMVAIFIPWAALGGWVEGFIPIDQISVGQFATAQDIYLGEGKTALLIRESQSASTSIAVVFLTVGLLWVIATVRRSILVTKKWRESAIEDEAIANFGHASFTGKLHRAHIRRLPNSSLIATTGLWQTEIWIGDRVTKKTHIETALNHELCHVASHDQYLLLLIVLIERVLWWNPLIWFLGRHARQSMEYACDFRCKTLIGDFRYRQSLAELFLVDHTFPDHNSQMTLGISFGHISDVVNRMENLQMNLKLKLRHLIVLGSASVLLTAAGVNAGSESSPKPNKTLIECLDLAPEGVKYDFRIISDIDTREGKKSELTVTLLDAENPEPPDWPVGSKQLMQCIQTVLGVGDDEGWPGT